MSKQLRSLKRHIQKLEEEKKELEIELFSIKNRKQKIFSIISHDLMGQIGVYHNIIEYLLEKIHTENIEISYIDKTLTQLKESSKSTYSLLENLLFWAKSQSSNLDYFAKDFQLSNLINSQVKIVKLSADNKNINIEIYNDNNIFMNTDENMLKTIIRNLLSNAIKFTETGGKIAISANLEGDTMVVIEVRDSGIGLSEEKIKSILNGKNTKSDIGTSGENGSGLGLILCRDFIQRLGGEFFISSIKNIGSSFKLRIPIHKVIDK